MQVFLFFIRNYRWQSVVVLLCLILAGGMEAIGLSAILPILSIGTASGSGPGQTSRIETTIRETIEAVGFEPRLGVLLSMMVIAYWLRAALMLLSKRQVGNTVAHVATDLRLGLLRALLNARWGFYTRQPVGAVANAMATEAHRGSRTYYFLAQVFTYGLQALLAITLAFLVSWKATLAAAGAGLLSVMALRVLISMAVRAGRKQTILLKSLLSALTDVLGSVKMLKATGREQLIGPLLEDDTRRLNKALRRQVLSKESLRALQDPISLSFIAAGMFAAIEIWGMQFEEIVVLVLLYSRTLTTVNKTQRKYQDVVTEASALWSMREMIERAEAAAEPSGGSRAPTLERGVSLEGVVLDYEDKRVLDGLDLEIPVGEVTAVVGVSGAGKTTIVDLVTGLVEPVAGSIRVDDVPLEELDRGRWRKMIGYVPQEMLLLHHTVRMNVALGDPDLDDAQVEQALRDAGAWDFVSQLPEGLDASVGERGTLLSGGQRQRIAIARALVHGAKLLVLDEATASLDSESEAAVWETVQRLRGRTTVVAISHQRALVGIADRVYRIEGGRAKRLDAEQVAAASAQEVA